MLTCLAAAWPRQRSPVIPLRFGARASLAGRQTRGARGGPVEKSRVIGEQLAVSRPLPETGSADVEGLNRKARVDTTRGGR